MTACSDGTLSRGNPNWATSPDNPAAQKYGAKEKVHPLSVTVCLSSGVIGE